MNAYTRVLRLITRLTVISAFLVGLTPIVVFSIFTYRNTEHNLNESLRIQAYKL